MGSEFATETKQVPEHTAAYSFSKTAAFSPAHSVIRIQQTIGNQRFLRLLASGQIGVSQPGDRCEQEADRIANQVIRRPESDLGQSEVENAGSTSSTTLSSLVGSGEPLSGSARTFFEHRFGVDFGHVRVHTSRAAQEAASLINARAFTLGNSIAFANGQFSPTSSIGRQLLAHELTHVVQQNTHSAFSREVIQRSFISWAAKAGIKRVAKGTLKNFIRTQIKTRIRRLVNKKFAKRFAREADQLMDILEDPWWVTGIGFIPVVGDIMDGVRVPRQIIRAREKADALERKIKAILRIQGQWAEKLIPASLKRSPSYSDDLARKSYGELVDLAESGNRRAAKMKKLIEEQHRLMEKL